MYSIQDFAAFAEFSKLMNRSLSNFFADKLNAVAPHLNLDSDIDWEGSPSN